MKITYIILVSRINISFIQNVKMLCSFLIISFEFNNFLFGPHNAGVGGQPFSSNYWKIHNSIYSIYKTFYNLDFLNIIIIKKNKYSHVCIIFKL